MAESNQFTCTFRTANIYYAIHVRKRTVRVYMLSLSFSTLYLYAENLVYVQQGKKIYCSSVIFQVSLPCLNVKMVCERVQKSILYSEEKIEERTLRRTCALTSNIAPDHCGQIHFFSPSSFINKPKFCLNGMQDRSRFDFDRLITFFSFRWNPTLILVVNWVHITRSPNTHRSSCACVLYKMHCVHVAHEKTGIHTNEGNRCVYLYAMTLLNTSECLNIKWCFGCSTATLGLFTLY